MSQTSTDSHAPTAGQASFAGLRPALRQFLRDLAEDNDRAWFAENRDRFESDVREPLLAFVAEIAPRLAAICPHLVADARPTGGSLLRIHRDLRFSADRRPYHTSVLVSFPHNGEERAASPGFTLRVQRDAVLLGVGVKPRGPVTRRRIRRHIDARARQWVAATQDDGFVGAFGGLGSPALRNVPDGFDPEHPLADDLRRNDFRASARVRLADAARPSFVEQAAETFREGAPLVRFLCDALGLPWK